MDLYCGVFAELQSAASLYAAKTGKRYYIAVCDDLPSNFVTDQTSEDCRYDESDASWIHTTRIKRKKYTWNGIKVVYGAPPEGVVMTESIVYIIPKGTTHKNVYSGDVFVFNPFDTFVMYARRSGTELVWYPSTISYMKSYKVQLTEPPKSMWVCNYGEFVYHDVIDRRIGWDPGALTAKAVSSAQGLSINSLQYLREIPSVSKTFIDTIKGVFALGRGDIKGVANAFLSGKYGTANTVRDTIDIAKYLYQGRTESGTHMHASGYGSSSGSNFAITYKDTMSAFAAPQCSNLPSQVVSGLRDADLLPSLENLWDVVPYSFVVNWVLPIGELLSSIDSSMDLLRYNITQCYYSRLVEYTTHDTEFEIMTTHYQRWSMPVVNPIGISSYSTAQGNHFLEASALLVQRVHT